MSKVTKLVLKSGNETWEQHRGDFQTCPECGEMYAPKVWAEAAHTLQLNPRFTKVDSVTIITACPKCGYNSWVHEPFAAFSKYATQKWPVQWKLDVQKEEARRRLQAARDWGASLCWNCKGLKEATIEYHAWRTCVVGYGPAETLCDKFKPLKKERDPNELH